MLIQMDFYMVIVNQMSFQREVELIDMVTTQMHNIFHLQEHHWSRELYHQVQKIRKWWKLKHQQVN